MNKLLLAAAALLTISPLGAAEFSIEGGAFEEMKASVSSFKDRLAPAAADKAVISTLFERLAKDGPSYIRTQKAEDGSEETLKVTLVEVQGPPEPEGLQVRDLVYRRYFSHMTGTRQTLRQLPDGRVELDQYDYTISLDGQIQSVKQALMTIVAATPQGLVAERDSARVYRLPPSDPSVQKRWQRMSAAFLGMGRTIEI